MEKYRLKKEAVPFFKEEFATKIWHWNEWQKIHVDGSALEEVAPTRIEYGQKATNSRTDLGGWDKNGGEFHFTIIFPSMKMKEYDDFSKGKVLRGLMDELQRTANKFYEGYSSEEKILKTTY